MPITKTSVAGVLVAVALAATVSAEEGNHRVILNIQPQVISKALMDLGEQAGLQVLVRGEDIRSDQPLAPVLTGEFTVQAALDRILTNSGLTYEFLDERTVRVLRENDERTSMLQHESAGVQLAQGGSTEASAGTADESAAQDSGPGTGSETSEVGEIVVTAQKRAQRLQDVPISISVMAGDALERSAVQGPLTEQLKTIPGILISPQINDQKSLTIRGVNGSTFGESSAVAYYVDTVPYGLVRRGLVPDSSSYDLDRIEVLKGPQATLFGASSLNGVVRVLTKDAELDHFDFKARSTVSGTQHGDANYGGDAAVNLPIIEGKLAARAVVGYQEFSGWIDKPDWEDSNDYTNSSVRFKIKAQPVEQLSIDLSAWRSRIDTQSTLSDDNRQNPLVRDEPRADDFDAYGLEASYEFSAFTVTSMTSYIEASLVSGSDTAPFGIAGSFVNDQTSDVFAQEVLLTSQTGSPWRWTLGGMYRDAQENLFQRFVLDVGGLSVAGDDTASSESFAVYGELTRVFLDGKLELTGGARYFEDKVTMRYDPRFAGDPRGAFGDTVSNVSPRVVLTAHPTGDLMVYASYAEGFRSGVPQHPGPFRSLGGIAGGVAPILDPDTLTNYELGAKGSFFDGLLDLDVSAYYMKWKNKPQSRIVTITVGSTTFPTPVLLNGEPLSGPGFDLGLTVRPLAALGLRTGLSWNDLQFDEDAPPGTQGLYSKGDRALLAPRLGVYAAADYVFPMGRNGWEGVVSVSANHTPEVPLDFMGAKTDSQWIARASFALQSQQHWGIMLFADNLTDWDGQTTLFPGFPPEHEYYNRGRVRPRTIGVQLDYHFR